MESTETAIAEIAIYQNENDPSICQIPFKQNGNSRQGAQGAISDIIEETNEGDAVVERRSLCLLLQQCGYLIFIAASVAIANVDAQVLPASDRFFWLAACFSNGCEFQVCKSNSHIF